MKKKAGYYLLCLAVLAVVAVKAFAGPNAVSDLAAQSSAVVEGQVQLTWTVPDTADSSPTPSGYTIKYSTSEINWADFYASYVSTYTYSWGAFEASGTPQTVTLTGFLPCATYYFAVVAIDTSGISGIWHSSTETGGEFNALAEEVIFDTTPAKVSGLSLNYGNNLINLSWQQVNSLDLKNYRVESSSYSSSAGFTQIATILAPGTTHQADSLINGNTYYYRVRAADNNGHLGFYSAVASTRPWISLSAPAWNVAYSRTISTMSINWSWNPLPANTSGYRIINSTSGVIYKEALSPGATYWVQNTLTPNASNTMLLEAFNGFVTRDTSGRTYHTYAIEPVNFSTTTLSSRAASLQWEHGSNAPDTSYIIERSSTNWSDFKTINLSAGATSYSDSGLLEATTFSYFIWGVNGEGARSSGHATYEIVTLNVNPGQPVLSPGCTTWINDGAVRLQWSAPYDDDGDAASGRCASYFIKWSSAPIESESDFDSIPLSSSTLVPDNAATPMEKIVTGLYPGTTFYFALKAIDKVGNYSVLSNTASVVAQDRIPDPPGSVMAAALSSASVNVGWTNPAPSAGSYDDRDEYAVYRATFSFVDFEENVSSFTVLHPTTYYIDIGLSPETTYYYRVKTLDKGDSGDGYFSYVYESSFSAPAAWARTPDTTPPDAISQITALTGVTEGKVNLIWTSTGDEGASGDIINGKFRIDYSTDVLNNFTTAYFKTEITTTTAPGDQNYRTVTGLAAAATYYFRIWAADEAMNWSCLSWGATAWAQVDVTPPSAINNISATPLWRRVVLNWTSPGDDGAVGVTTGTVEVRTTNAGPITNQTEWDSVPTGFPYRIVFSTSVSPGTAKSHAVTGLNDGTAYYFAIRTFDERGNESAISTVSPSTAPVNSLPAAFSLTGPADLIISTSTSVKFTWQASSDAQDSPYGDTLLYRVYRSTNSDFSAPAVQSDTSLTDITLDMTAYEDKTVYWKVAAMDRDAIDFGVSGTTSTPVSRIVRINVNNTPPGAFDLIGPSTGTVIQGSSTPTLSWTVSANVDPGDILTYRVDYSQSQDFSAFVSSDYIPSTSYTTPSLLENTTYWWRVWAYDYVFRVMSNTTGYFRINAFQEPPAAFNLNAPAEGTELSTTTVTFNWAATTDPDPDESVTYNLSWSQLANFSSSFTVTGLTGTTTSYPDFNDNGVYYWRVAAVGSCGQARQSAQTNKFYVDTVKQLPGAFTLLEPAYNAVISTSVRPLFSWSPAVDPDPADDVRYIFEISPRADFAGSVPIDRAGDRYYVPPADLSDQTTYYWRVKASGYQGYPPVQVDPGFTQSAVYAFAIYITNTPPQSFALLSPANGSKAGTKKPLLKWGRAEDPDVNSVVNYAVTLSEQPDFSTVVESAQGILATQYQIQASLNENRTYYWKVTATDNKNGSTNCSSAFSFILPVLNTPQVPAGLVGTLSPDKLKFNIAWSPVVKNTDGSALDDLASYRIYRGSDQKLSLLATVPAAASQWTDETMQGVEYYYRVSAVDSSGIESVLEDSPLLNSRLPDTLKFISEDRSLTIDVPSQVAKYLLAENNPYSKNLRIRFERNPSAESDKTLSSYYLKVMTSDDTSVERFSFEQPLTLKFGYGSGTFAGRRLAAMKVPSAELGSLNVYWNNNIEYIRIGGNTVPGDQQFVLKANRTGEYQLRRVSRASSFAVASLYPPKVFTPNIAPYEQITFYVDNPQGDKVTGKIFNLNGSFMADLSASGDVTSTSVILYWDGKNSDGVYVSKGVYIYQIEGSGKVINGTVMVAR